MNPFIESFTNNEIFLFFTDFVFELTDTIKANLISYGFDEAKLNNLFTTDDKRKYSQVAGLFNQAGYTDFISLSPLDDGTFHFGLKGTVGPIPLTGEKSGFDFQAEVSMDWLWQWNNGTQKTTAEVSHRSTRNEFLRSLGVIRLGGIQ